MYSGSQFAADTLGAIAASFCVAPFITIIDRSIIQNASGAKPLKLGLVDGMKELFTRPHIFVSRREFHMIWALYYVTYQTAHTVTTVCDNMNRDVVIPKFIATTAVNASACIAKDRAFTRMFGVKAPTGLPYSTYALFLARDCGTIFASFSLPPIVAGKMIRDFRVPNETAQNVAQLGCPVLVQLLSTPLHLLGLNMYNVQQASPSERFKTVKSQYLQSTAARMGRIFPAFGIGGVLSRKFRLGLRDQFGVPQKLAA